MNLNEEEMLPLQEFMRRTDNDIDILRSYDENEYGLLQDEGEPALLRKSEPELCDDDVTYRSEDGFKVPKESLKEKDKLSSMKKQARISDEQTT